MTVKLDDGSGTFPYDISTYVRGKDGLSISKGRADEFGSVQPSTLSLTLENTDGRFTYGSATYGIAVDQAIQVTYSLGSTTSVRFTGYVTAWPTAWPDGSDLYATAQVTAVDALARLSRRQLRSMVEQEYLADAPVGYWKLSEAQGATSSTDASGNAAPPLLPVDNDTAGAATTRPGLPVIFGQDAELLGNAVQFQPQSFTAGQPTSQTLAISGAPTPAVTGVTWEMFVNLTGGPNDQLLRVDNQPVSTGQMVTWYLANGAYPVRGAVMVQVPGASLLYSTRPVNDGAWHHIASTNDGTTLRLYVDGAMVASTAVTGVAPMLGREITLLDSVNTSYAAHFAEYATALSAARIKAHADAGLSGFNTERSDQRIARLLSYAKITATALEAGSQQSVPPQATDGGSALDAVEKVSDSEHGLFFIRGDGLPVLQNRIHRAVQTTPDLTLTNDDIDPGSAFTVDMQGVVNYVQAKGVSGLQQTVQNLASLAQHDQYPSSLDLLVKTDQEALDRANWLVATDAQPQPRLPNVAVDLLTLPTAKKQALLGLGLSDRVQITGLPGQSPGGTTADLLVEGWTEVLSLNQWSMTFNTSNTVAARQFVLDGPTLGVLDSAVPLGI